MASKLARTVRKLKDHIFGNHITATYQSIRIGMVIVTLALPLILWLGGRSCGLPLQGSMSAYYHASCDGAIFGNGLMRDWFVGGLFGLGMILFMYRGYTFLENWALNFAGILICCVALIPMGWPVAEESGFGFSAHGICAVVFFLLIAYVCIFRARDTVSLISDPARQKYYKRWYRIIGALMIASPLIAIVLKSVLAKQHATVFFVEMAGVYVFAVYWFVKSKEILETNADEKVACGHVQVAPHNLSDCFKSIAVTVHHEHPAIPEKK
jgi:hypothetical protein